MHRLDICRVITLVLTGIAGGTRKISNDEPAVEMEGASVTAITYLSG
jgi:hypothetical protein